MLEFLMDGFQWRSKSVDRAQGKQEQIDKLLGTKGAFSASAHWNVCGSRIGNTSVVLRAQTEFLAVEARSKLASQSQNKSQRHAKLRLVARQALVKYEAAPTTMTDKKDWVEIIKWVLPVSNADGLLKDLRKKDVILQKLMSLDRDWKMYIPPVDEV